MKNKFYTVWNGRQIGVFSSWNDCRLQVEGFQGARYKGFPDRISAENAFKCGFESFKNDDRSISEKLSGLPENTPKPNTSYIAVDAACSGNPGKMEYRGVYVETGVEIFKSPVFEGGTNNIGEFLAIVHCLAWEQKNNLNIPIYSDSLNAKKWIGEGLCRTKIQETNKNVYLFQVIKRAEKWLAENSFRVPIYKWRTEIWGEIPADFGRK